MPESAPKPIAACAARISVDDARATMDAAIHPISAVESVPLTGALGRVLAVDVMSPINVPAHDNSAMDGYAFHGNELRADGDLELHCIGTVLAGMPPMEVGTGECIRIMTGAVLPSNLDTVVPLELCQIHGEQVLIGAGAVRAGDNRRCRGEDLSVGHLVIRAGRILKPADIGLAASIGLTELSVMRRLRVAVFSTGDEVILPGQPLPRHCIYDSNRYALIAAIQRLGMEVMDFGLLRDEPEQLLFVLKRAANEADAVITSGGVSAGDADYVRDVMAKVGVIDFWSVAMQPGRPFAFGSLNGDEGQRAWLFALPGNPVASLVVFYVFAREALLKIAGARPEPLPALRVRSETDLRKRPGRIEFQRGYVSRGSDGQWQVRRAGPQGSGILRSMSQANALIVLAHDQGSVTAGELVDVWLFDGLT